MAARAAASPRSNHQADGHRERLRSRFAKAGADALPDYELLEMVLFRAIRRGDTKPLAKALLSEFGSFAEVVSASPERLTTVPGIGAAAAGEIKLVHAAALRMIRTGAFGRRKLQNWTAVLDYLRATLAYAPIEHFRILFLDRRNQLIADEEQQRGTVDHTPVYPREVMKRALELGASAIVLVHNHPSGDPTPSAADVEMTRRIVEAGQKLQVTVHDHIIIARGGHASFKALGLL
jgi:DNA repair protein RadC